MPIEIRALIFDMDGVVIDSNPVHREVWARYNRRHGVETTEEMQQRMYGKRNDEIVRDFLGESLTDAEVAGHGAAKERLYREMVLPVIPQALVPGIREFLTRHSDLPIGMGTNAEPANVQLVLEAAGLAKYFRAIVDGQQVARPKPHPDIYLRVAEILGVAPANCVVFEDSYSGVAAGVAAGMRVVGLQTTHEVLDGTDLAIPDFRDPRLEGWFQGIAC